MENNWYIVAPDGQRVGPLLRSQLKEYGLTPSTVVWHPGMADWQAAAGVAPLADLLGAATEVVVDEEAVAVESQDIPVDDGPKYPSGPQSNPGYGPQGQPGYGPNPGYAPQGQPGYGPNPGYGPQGQPGYGPNPGYGPQGYPNNNGNWRQGAYDNYIPATDKSGLVAGLLAIIFGSLGVQYFYCGKIGGGFLCILLTLITCGAWYIVSLIQGIYMLTLTPAEFERKYVLTNSTFPLF